MSEVTRVLIITEHADGTTRHYRALHPEGATLRFAEGGGLEAQAAPGKTLTLDVQVFANEASAAGTS